MKRKLIYVFTLVFCQCLMAQSKDSNAREQNFAYEFDSLVWSDEFEDSGSIDTSKWFHQTKLPPWGEWFGGLINHYTDRIENTFVEGGFLNIVARKETFEDQGRKKEYTSARLNSKFTFKYGRLEVRAKVPTGVGTWPAIWLLNKNINEDGAYWEEKGFGTTDWPRCGEIDLLEHWGKNQDYIQSAVHTAASYGDKVVNLGGRMGESVSDQFHVYSLDWNEESMTFSMDGIIHYIYQPSQKNLDNWPFDMEYYLIMNIAIERDIEIDFTESPMVIDYVRIYQ